MALCICGELLHLEFPFLWDIITLVLEGYCKHCRGLFLHFESIPKVFCTQENFYRLITEFGNFVDIKLFSDTDTFGDTKIFAKIFSYFWTQMPCHVFCTCIVYLFFKTLVNLVNVQLSIAHLCVREDLTRCLPCSQVTPANGHVLCHEPLRNINFTPGKYKSYPWKYKSYSWEI